MASPPRITDLERDNLLALYGLKREPAAPQRIARDVDRVIRISDGYYLGSYSWLNPLEYYIQQFSDRSK